MKTWLQKLVRSDRRRAARVETDRLVAYYWDGSPPAPRRVVNISSNGFCLEATCSWRPGTLVNMTIQRARVHGDNVRREDYIVLVTRVAWRSHTGVGLEFIPREHMGSAKVQSVGAPATKRAIQRFIESCQDLEPARMRHASKPAQSLA